ncbi:MAG: carboxypeptidase regulatory-like domain-containing protein, partial [Sedimentisphaerales bacterium]|nr:carboxypeptidase regulatory-like domain-containing protein [Sedimentisphaerales bacterium]
MSMRLIIAGALILSYVFCSGSSVADVPKKISCCGKVIDDANKPVAGAKVTLYQLTPDERGQELKTTNTEEQITKEDGSFCFSAETPGERQYSFAMLIARKEGLSIGWDNWDIRKDKTTVLTMSKPYSLRGTIVDDAGKPVGGAEVRISILLTGNPLSEQEKVRYLSGIEPLDFLVTNTDAKGNFVFNNIPVEAKAEFTVKKAGRATVSTFKPPQSINSPSDYNPGQYTVESKDIRIVQPMEARIEGKVVEKGTGKAVGGVRLVCITQEPGGTFGVKPIVSKDDGTFSFEGLEAKTYTIMGVLSREKIAEWIIKPETVTAEAGQNSSGIILEASKGGMLEVTIRDNEKKPVSGASVYARMQNNDKQGGSGVSNSDGIAAIRLSPGEYAVGAYKQGYSYLREQRTVTVEDGEIARLEIKLKAYPRITGIVRDPSGRPVAGATLRICPIGQQKETNSDKEGKFEVSWIPEHHGDREPQFVLVARHAGQKLTAVVDIEKDTKTIDVNMSPGIEFSGKVIDLNGKPIAGAKVNVSLRVSNYSSSFDNDVVVTDHDGRYEYKAIPEKQKYSVSARADGYGRSNTEADADYAVENHLEITALTLKEAALSISGIVVDANDKPMANTEVYVNGQGQQFRHSTTDIEGKFIIDKLCEGQVYVNANFRNGRTYLHGNVSAKAGDTDVKVVVGLPQRSGEMADITNQPAGTLEILIIDDANVAVGGANVSVRKKDDNRWKRGVSDEIGVATLKLLPGEYDLQEIRKEGYSSPRKRQTVTIAVGETVRLEIVLKANPRITGIVRDPNGQPVARAAMKIFPWGQNARDTDKEGRFEISWNPGQGGDREPQPVLVVRHIKGNLADAVDIDEDTKTLDVNMLPGIVFTGTVIDSNDKPISGAKINVTLSISGHGMNIDTADVAADQQGKYECKAIPAGRQYTVSARADGYGQSYARVDADDAVGNHLEITPLTLKEAALSISGIVVDINDMPMANAEVYINGQGQQHRRGTTDAEGKFAIDKLCEGQVQVNANFRNGRSYLHGNLSVNAGDTNVKIVVGSPERREAMADIANQPSGTLEVIIVDDANEAVAGANVSVREKDGNRWKNGISDENGIASLKLLPGEYELVEIRKEGYSSSRARQTVTIEVGETIRLEIELKANPRIAGVVRDPNGQPVARAVMRIFPGGQNETYSDKEGEFKISWNPERWGIQGIEPILIARHIRRNLAAAIDIDENSKIIDVNMLPGIEFSGVVIDANNELIAGAKINVTLGMSGYGAIDTADVITDQDGRYEYKNIPAGRQYTVSAQADGYGQSYAGADTKEAAGNHLEIKPIILKEAALSISGIVVD